MYLSARRDLSFPSKELSVQAGSAFHEVLGDPALFSAVIQKRGVPGSPTGFGIWVKKAQLSDPTPLKIK